MPIHLIDRSEYFSQIAAGNFTVLKNLASIEDEKELFDALCLAAIKQNRRALRHIPKDKLSHDVCLEAIKAGWLRLWEVPEEHRSSDICFHAVEQDARQLRDVPVSKQNHAIFLTAIKQDAEMLADIPEDKLDFSLCFEAVKENGLLLKKIPSNKQSPEIYIAAVSNNGMALSIVPTDKKAPEICMAAVIQNGLALHFVPTDQRNFEICMAAFKQNILALQYVPISIKEAIIRQQISEQKFFSMFARNYKVHHYLDEWNTNQNRHRFLKNIEHVVITDNNAFHDPEIYDAYTVYSNHSRRVRKTVHMHKDDAQQLFDDMKGVNAHSINMVLLDHSFSEATSIAGFDIKNILLFLKKNHQINRVTLLGCNTAKSIQLDDEQAAIKHFAASRLYSDSFLHASNMNSLFAKTNSEYKKHKQQYPFLSSLTISAEEDYKLKDSLMKKLVIAIQHSEIMREIIVKGYTKAVYVDHKEQRMHASDTYLYTKDRYIREADNINRNTLFTERSLSLKSMAEEKLDGDTSVKSIKIALAKY